jgi:hypothetical protein
MTVMEMRTSGRSSAATRPSLARDEHRLVLAGKRGHDLHNARIQRARPLLEARENGDFSASPRLPTGSAPG